MAYTLAVVTPASLLPVDIATAKLHCHVNTTVEDSLLLDWVAAAVECWEKQSGYTPTSTTYQLQIDHLEGRILRLPRRPVTSIGTVTYLDIAGTWQTLTDYSVDMVSLPARIIFPNSLPSLHPTQLPRIKVQFTAGHSSTAAVPRTITTAITRLACHWFHSRDLGDDAKATVPANWQWAVDQFSMHNCGDVWGERFDSVSSRNGNNTYFGGRYGG